MAALVLVATPVDGLLDTRIHPHPRPHSPTPLLPSPISHLLTTQHYILSTFSASGLTTAIALFYLTDTAPKRPPGDNEVNVVGFLGKALLARDR
jgi:hypothetical protein